MRKEGTIVRWDAGKGFGFIRSGSVAQDVFVHVRDYLSRDGHAPREGLRVTFEDIHVGGKGPRAVAVQPIAAARGNEDRTNATRRPLPPRNAGGRLPGRASHSGAWLAVPLVLAYALALIWLVSQQQVPWWTLVASFLLNVATFFAYWQDKYAAQQRGWRTREDTLHLWSLAGGWSGAWFAQQVLRHKSVKASFRSVYWVTVVVHCAAASGIWWFSQAT